MNKIKQHINEYLLNRLPEMAAFCSRLVQTPSVNGLHDERNMAKAIAAQARSLGLHTQIVGHNLQRPNIIVTTAAAGPTGLLLVGHLDTVPEGDPSQWRFPPFSGQAAGGKIFGRGAVDTKGGITAALYALAALSHIKDALPYGRVQFIGVPDEESGATGTLGVKYLDEAGLLEGSGAIYVYPGVDEIPLGHRGLIRFRLIAHGQSAHTGLVGKQGSKQRGQNAVTAMAGLLLLLEQIEPPISKIAYFDQFRAAITPGTAINGGTAINIIPDRCEALIDIRTIPEFDLPEAEAALAQAMAAVAGQRSGLRFEYELLNYLPYAISDSSAPLFTIAERVVQSVKSFTPKRVVCGPANEGYLFIERGIPIICGFGPTGANAHAVDEYVEINSLAEAALIYCLTARELSLQLAKR